MEEKYYGILMHRIVLDQGLYVFKPKALVEGHLINEAEGNEYEDESFNITYFMDNNSCEYNLATDSYMLDTEEDIVVGYPISETKLMEKFPDFTLDEAKEMYIGDAFDHIHLGCLMYDTCEIKITPTNLQDYLIKMNGLEPGEEEEFIVEEEDSVVNDNEEVEDSKECVFMSMDYFEEILKIEDPDLLKATLKKVYNAAVEITSNLEKQADNSLEAVYDSVYTTILNMNNLTQMKKAISKVKHVYSDKLSSLMHDDNDVSESIKELHVICDPYNFLIRTDDIKVLKKEFKALKKSTITKLKALDPEIQTEIASELKKAAIEEPKVKFDVQDIKKHFDDRIIGQEEAKRDVISAIYMNKLNNDPTNKNNCLLLGPTGSGKTLLAETVAEYFDMPIEIIDTTQLTVPGYVGANLDDFLERLLNKADGDLKKAEEGIVVFDEIDKKGSDSNSDISGKGVLNTLLPFIGGTTYDVKYNGRMVRFDTSKLTIFATGAFTDTANDKEKVYNGTSIGFGSHVENKKEDIEYSTITREDLIKKGNLPAELIGRFSVITQLSGHTLESLKSILTDSDRSALLSEKEKLANIGIELSWTNGYLEAVANEAIKLKTGARSLKSTVDKSIKEVRWEVISNLDKYSGIILTEQTVKDNLDCLLVDKDGNTEVFKNIIEEKAKVKVKE